MIKTWFANLVAKECRKQTEPLVFELNRQLDELRALQKKLEIDAYLNFEQYQKNHTEAKNFNERHQATIEGWLKIFLEKEGIKLEELEHE